MLIDCLVVDNFLFELLIFVSVIYLPSILEEWISRNSYVILLTFSFFLVFEAEVFAFCRRFFTIESFLIIVPRKFQVHFLVPMTIQEIDAFPLHIEL